MDGLNYMKYINFLKNEYDVIIVGGGTAGSAAGISAAMEGVKTLIIENCSYLGGSSTGGQVFPMMHCGLPGNNDGSFINAMIKKHLNREGYGAADVNGNDGWFNPEMLKYILDDIYLGYGGNVCYETRFIDAFVEDRHIKGILVHNRDGLQIIRGKYYIDCTGDAEMAFKSGVTCFSGDEAENKNQASSLRFMVGNIDLKKLEAFLKDIGENTLLDYPLFEISASWEDKNPLSNIFKIALNEGALEIDDCKYFQAFSIPGMPGVMGFNCPEIPNIDNSISSSSINLIYITGRRMIKRLFRFLKMYLPGFENSFIMSTASLAGIRESRRIKGKYVITEQDHASGTKFYDAIAKTAYPIDIHHAEIDKSLELGKADEGLFMEIPFRCLVTEEIDNLLVAGRCISSTFTAQSAIRIQLTCRAMGEASGIASAYCSKMGIPLSSFDAVKIREIMTERFKKQL